MAQKDKRHQATLHISQNQWIMLRQICLSRSTSVHQLCTEWVLKYIAEYLEPDSVGKPQTKETL